MGYSLKFALFGDRVTFANRSLGSSIRVTRVILPDKMQVMTYLEELIETFQHKVGRSTNTGKLEAGFDVDTFGIADGFFYALLNPFLH